jgi:crotonobetainyl-CoA:carnitine CoA-transferase CaiB-like acyl-CoA transferase
VTADERAGALESLTILDLSEGIAGPYAAQLFAHFGALVIKVERPGRGDMSRGWAPFVGERPDKEMSLNFLALNAGKLGLTLDYETATGAEVLQRLTEDADGIIEDHSTRRRNELGLSDEALIARIPRLVIVQVSGYGSSGPYSDRALTGLTLAAAVGALPPAARGPTYDHDMEPVLGMNAFIAALAGLSRAAQTEHGQVVEVSGMEALAIRAGAGPVGGDAGKVEIDSLRRDGLVRAVEHPAAGSLEYPVAPFSLSRTAATPLSPAPRLSEHTDYVLQDLIGMDGAEVEALRAQGIV